MEQDPCDRANQCSSWKHFFALRLCFSSIHLCHQQAWNHIEICFQYHSYFLHEFFLLLFCFGKQCESLTALYRKFTLQPWVNILENCLVFALLYFTVLVLSSFKFAGCLLSLSITTLEGTRGVIFLQLAYDWQLLLLPSKSSCLKMLWVRPDLAMAVYWVLK